MTVIAEVTTYPIGKGISLSSHVKEAMKVLKESGLKYQIGPMSTAIEAKSNRQIGPKMLV